MLMYMLVQSEILLPHLQLLLRFQITQSLAIECDCLASPALAQLPWSQSDSVDVLSLARAAAYISQIAFSRASF